MIGRLRDRAKASAACCETVSVLIMLPMDMKNLERTKVSAFCCQPPIFPQKHAYPNVAPDPTMYCPNVRITPFGPAPYLMMLTEPSVV